MKLFLLAALTANLVWGKAESLEWHSWSEAVFQQARAENRFVLLDLEAVWCHWCHVMDETTYRDPAVMALLRSRYLLVKTDQDSRPDISNRYQDYGWPATIVLNGKGQEIVKRSGYIEPREMESMLRAIIADPSPGPSVEAERKLDFSHGATLSEAQKKDLTRSFFDKYDFAKGAWGFRQKFLDGLSEEYAMILAATGDARAMEMAKQTLRGELRLVDPAWGGVYQYSVGGDWNEPHFEKIMQTQAVNLRAFTQGYALWKDQQFLSAAQSIRRFLTTFLTSPQGAFYTSQDADLVQGEHSAAYFKLSDTERRKRGVPRIDQHIYSRENGWAIEALTKLYEVTKDPNVLNQALKATRWVQANRALPGGGFRHDERDAAGPYLGDTLAMGRAFLGLYTVTGDREWLRKTEAACAFIAANFSPATGAGFATTKTRTDPAYVPHPEREENIQLARLANQLFRISHNPEHQKIAQQAMRYIAEPHVAAEFPTAGALLIDLELRK